MNSPQHGDETVSDLPTGSWLGGVGLHGCRPLLALLLGVRCLRDWRWRPHQPDVVTALEHPSQNTQVKDIKYFKKVNKICP